MTPLVTISADARVAAASVPQCPPRGDVPRRPRQQAPQKTWPSWLTSTPSRSSIHRRGRPAERTSSENASGQEGCAGGGSRRTRPVKIPARGRQPGQSLARRASAGGRPGLSRPACSDEAWWGTLCAGLPRFSPFPGCAATARRVPPTPGGQDQRATYEQHTSVQLGQSGYHRSGSRTSQLSRSPP